MHFILIDDNKNILKLWVQTMFLVKPVNDVAPKAFELSTHTWIFNAIWCKLSKQVASVNK